MRKSVIYSILAALVIAVPSCKKNDTTTTTPSLSGLAVEEVVPYVGRGTIVTVNPKVKGLYTSNGSKAGTIGLAWQVNTAKKDTLCKDISKGYDSFRYYVDTLGKYSIYCYAFANGYYSSSAVTTVECIDPDDALTGVTMDETVTIAGNEWMATNLYDPLLGEDYKKAEIVSPLFGRFYTWEEALIACPIGWHLPSADEWDTLGSDAYALMAPAKFQKLDMWEPALGQMITNSLGFNVIPVGYMDKTASIDKFRGKGQYSAYWTSSVSENNPDFAQMRYFLYDNPDVQEGEGDISSLALSVRCVKD